MGMESELVRRRNEVEILSNEEDTLKMHISRLESEVKNLRLSEHELKHKLSKREEEYQKKLSDFDHERRKDTERLKSELDSVRDQHNETSKMHTLHFSSQEDTDSLRNENSRLKEELKLLETRFEVFNRELARLKKENQE